MIVAAYLERIGFREPVAPTHETLCALQRAHLLTVPFENLDIVPLHRPIRLDEHSLWDKIVRRGRGGFCYELNGMFAWLLQQIGFDVTYLNSRVFRRDGSLGIEFDHLALLVRAPGEPGEWLADVGFGDFSVEPLAFRDGEQPQGLRSYRLERDGERYVTWQRDYDGTWERQYSFDLTPRVFPRDYAAGCLYHQTSPDSSFTRGSVISRLTENGRITLEHSKLIQTENGKRSEIAIREEEWPRLLKEHFGVVL